MAPLALDSRIDPHPTRMRFRWSVVCFGVVAAGLLFGVAALALVLGSFADGAVVTSDFTAGIRYAKSSTVSRPLFTKVATALLVVPPLMGGAACAFRDASVARHAHAGASILLTIALGTVCARALG